MVGEPYKKWKNNRNRLYIKYRCDCGNENESRLDVIINNKNIPKIAMTKSIRKNNVNS